MSGRSVRPKGQEVCPVHRYGRIPTSPMPQPDRNETMSGRSVSGPDLELPLAGRGMSGRSLRARGGGRWACSGRRGRKYVRNIGNQEPYDGNEARVGRHWRRRATCEPPVLGPATEGDGDVTGRTMSGVSVV